MKIKETINKLLNLKKRVTDNEDKKLLDDVCYFFEHIDEMEQAISRCLEVLKQGAK